MDQSTRTKLAARKSLLARVTGLKKKSVLTLAGIFLITSGGYYEVKKLPLVEILYVEKGSEHFFDLLENTDKKGLILFYTDYCFPCEKMNDVFRKNVELASMVNHSFVPYKVDAFDKEFGTALQAKYNIEHFPTLIITNQEGIEIDRIDLPEESLSLTEKLSAFSKRLSMSKETVGIKTSLGKKQQDFLVKKRGEYIEKNVEEFEAETEKPSFSLSLEIFDSYTHARSSALLKTKLWKNEIWIEQAGADKYRLMLGRFEKEEEGLMAQNYLKSWEGVESEIHELNSKPQQYK